MIKTRIVGQSGGPPRLASFLAYSEPFAREIDITADVSEADAKAAFILVPEVAPGIEWPMWQISTRFSAGTTKAADITVHRRDRVTRQWHALALIQGQDDAAVTVTNGQVLQFEAPACSDALAIEIDITTADDRPHITIRGVAYVQTEI